MKYSAGMVSGLFWLSETRKTAELLVAGKTLKEIRLLAQDENIYQVKSEDRVRRITNETLKRLQSLPDILVDRIANGDIASAKILILISIMKTDLLFFEFIHDVYRTTIILGETIITDRSINTFFDEKIIQSESVAKWTEATIQRLKLRYLGILREAGVVMDDKNQRKIITPHIDYKLRKQLEDNGFTPYLNAITGEA